MRSTAYRPPFYPALLTLATLPDFVKGKPRDEVRLDPFVVIGLHILLGIVTIGLVVLHRLAFGLSLGLGAGFSGGSRSHSVVLGWPNDDGNIGYHVGRFRLGTLSEVGSAQPG